MLMDGGLLPARLSISVLRMSVASVWRAAILAASLFAGLAGCDYLERTAKVNEETEAHYIDGVTAKKLHEYDKAISDFENALKANPNSGAAHRELALLYDHSKNRHLRAMYHYERFSELRTNEVNQLIRDRMYHCRVMVARENFETLERTQVRSEVEELRKKLLDAQTKAELFQRELASARALSNQVQVLQQQLGQSTTLVTQLQNQLENQAQALSVANSKPQAIYSPPDSTTPRGSGSPTSYPSNPPKPNDRPTSRSESGTSFSTPSRPTITQPSASKTPPATSLVYKRTHRVQPGETLSYIAKRYGLSLAAIRSANPRLDPNRIRPGVVLNLPDR